MKNPLRTPIEAPGSHPKPILRVWIINLAAAERNYFDDRILLTSSSSRPFYGVVLWGKRQRESTRERDEKEQKTLTKKKTRKNFEIFSLCLRFLSFSLFFSLFSLSLTGVLFGTAHATSVTLSLVISHKLRRTLSTWFSSQRKTSRALSLTLTLTT